MADTDTTAAIEHEQIRQQWLQAMALTPWVATETLPAAPRSAYWSIAPTGDDQAPEEATTATQPANKTTTNPAAAVLQQLSTSPSKRARTTPQPTPATTKQPAGQTAPKLITCLAGHTLIIATQEDAQLPEPSVAEQQLFASLQQLFAQSSRHYPFSCPSDAPHANATLAAFVDGLALQDCQQCLFCLNETQSHFLLGNQARHTPFTLSGLPAVIVSSLAEMLTDPLTHKRQSWQSICQAGLTP